MKDELGTLSYVGKKKVFAVAMVIIFITALGILLSFRPWQKNSPGPALPASVTAQISAFNVYFYKRSIPAGYKLDAMSVKYDNGILLAKLAGPANESITLTQQELPESLASQPRENFEKVNGAAGEAYITYQGTKMAGGLFSDKVHGKRTLILLVANDPIEKSVMEDLLRSLRTI